ncbi:primary-amine oxidase [Solirubrobacter soli]|uniref:primary-amine oxidase n=1 Tax=Solirubrobacter soli TaxID=363832 RepID=UPI0004048153|nr:primary-amine oxidase [Solirubrobacter soli]
MHALDPLSADEFRQAAAVLRRDHGVSERWRFASIELKEPQKGVTSDAREAIVVCWNRDGGAAYRAVVSLTGDTTTSWEELAGIQPNLTPDEWHECDEAMRAEPRLIEALAKRGITDMSNVLFDVWGYRGFLVPEQYADRRVGWTDTWYRSEPGSNPYANPVNGLHCVVDLNTMELLEIEDTSSVDKPAGTMGEYVPRFVPNLKQRQDLKAVEITQPEGVSFTLDGHALRWQNWSLRLGFNHREGLVLHTLAFGGRSVAHRISLAEMVVPYRDPSPDHFRRTAYDIGEWGLGFMTQSLELGCDCLGEIRYVDAVLHDTAAEPYVIKNAVCIHEEDDGVLWKHVDHTEGAEVRRARRLVISVHVTVANYEYLVYWRLYQDGSIECHVRATGIMVVGHLPEGEPAKHGTMVDQRTYAPFHQHFLIARLDLDVDGPDNTVQMVETSAAGYSDADPYGLGLKQTAETLTTEGFQDYKWETQRGWKVTNPSSLNHVGTPVAYKLVPGATLPHMLPEDSPVLRTAEALRHTLWVTPYDAAERWPCGPFPNQSDTDDGLPTWTAAGRSIEDTDVVLWYVFGIHHITRMEDWPIMPVDTVSFWLKPFGFFDRNPTLDVPPQPSHCEH